MKTKNLIAALALIAQTLTGATSFAQGMATASASDGGHTGNGGGLINRNGRWMTFESAHFLTDPTESTSDEVPQLSALLRFFNTTPYMSEMTKVKYASNLMPSPSRQYFRVKPDTFTPEVRARLIAEYGRVMKVTDTTQLALAAITDTQSKTTYLFPEFYSLQPTEQMAILFHETYWLVNPTATYDNVVQIEMLFQAYLEQPQSAEKLLRWLQKAGTPGDILTGAIRTDLANNSMKGLIEGNNQISMTKLLGVQAVDCEIRGERGNCVPFIATNAYALTQQYPNSLFLRLLLQSSATGKIALLGDDCLSSKNDLLVDVAYGYRKNSFGETYITSEIWNDIAKSKFDLNSIGYTQGPLIPSTVTYLIDDRGKTTSSTALELGDR